MFQGWKSPWISRSRPERPRSRYLQERASRSTVVEQLLVHEAARRRVGVRDSRDAFSRTGEVAQAAAVVSGMPDRLPVDRDEVVRQGFAAVAVAPLERSPRGDGLQIRGVRIAFAVVRQREKLFRAGQGNGGPLPPERPGVDGGHVARQPSVVVVAPHDDRRPVSAVLVAEVPRTHGLENQTPPCAS